MSELLEIITQIEDTEAAIAKTEQAFVTYPNEPGLRLALASLEKRQQVLSEDFKRLSSDDSQDDKDHAAGDGQNLRDS